MYVFCFQTCFAAYKHTRISAKAQLFLHLPKTFLQGRSVQCKYVALFLLFFIFKIKNRSRGTAFTSTNNTLISLFWLQEAQEPCLSIESPAKTMQRLIHVFTGYTGSVGKAVPWRFTCVLMQQNTFENKIHTCYEIKQLNVKTCFCVFKV